MTTYAPAPPEGWWPFENAGAATFDTAGKENGVATAVPSARVGGLGSELAGTGPAGPGVLMRAGPERVEGKGWFGPVRIFLRDRRSVVDPGWLRFQGAFERLHNDLQRGFRP
jgi:hypothetical protein